MPSTKYAGLNYPTHFLKSRGSVIRNTFLEYRTNKATHFARRNDCYALSAINKANHILNRLFSIIRSSPSNLEYSRNVMTKKISINSLTPSLKAFLK